MNAVDDPETSGPDGAGRDTGGSPPPVVGPIGLVNRILAGWRDLRGSFRSEIAAGHGEPRLLAYAMGGCVALALARAPQSVLGMLDGAAAAGQPVSITMLVVMQVVAALFFLPLMLYAVAALARMTLRLFGGAGGWFDTRLAVFWSLVLAAPILLVGGLFSFGFALTNEAGRLAGLPSVIAQLIWLRFWAEGLAEAHAFRSGFPIFVGMAVLAAVISGLAQTASPV